VAGLAGATCSRSREHRRRTLVAHLLQETARTRVTVDPYLSHERYREVPRSRDSRRLHWADGSNAGEAEYAVLIKPGETVGLNGGQKARVVGVVPVEGQDSPIKGASLAREPVSTPRTPRASGVGRPGRGHVWARTPLQIRGPGVTGGHGGGSKSSGSSGPGEAMCRRLVPGRRHHNIVRRLPTGGEVDNAP
jgi:hypothetical protein